MSILAVGLSPQYARKLIRCQEIALREKLNSGTIRSIGLNQAKLSCNSSHISIGIGWIARAFVTIARNLFALRLTLM